MQRAWRAIPAIVVVGLDISLIVIPVPEAGGARAGGGVLMSCMAVVLTIDRPSHPCNAGTEHVGLSPTRQAMLLYLLYLVVFSRFPSFNRFV